MVQHSSTGSQQRFFSNCLVSSSCFNSFPLPATGRRTMQGELFALVLYLSAALVALGQDITFPDFLPRQYLKQAHAGQSCQGLCWGHTVLIEVNSGESRTKILSQIERCQEITEEPECLRPLITMTLISQKSFVTVLCLFLSVSEFVYFFV